MPDFFRASRNAAISSFASGGANHCLLFFTKICAAVKPQACARMTDCETPPLVEVCAPRSDPAGRFSDTLFLSEAFLFGAADLGAAERTGFAAAARAFGFF